MQEGVLHAAIDARRFVGEDSVGVRIRCYVLKYLITDVNSPLVVLLVARLYEL